MSCRFLPPDLPASAMLSPSAPVLARRSRAREWDALRGGGVNARAKGCRVPDLRASRRGSLRTRWAAGAVTSGAELAAELSTGLPVAAQAQVMR